MLVCHCMKITDSQIIEKVRNGLDTVEDLARECGITMGCGGCYSLVEKIVKEETNKHMEKFPRCPECGGEVKLLAKEGRTREYIKGIHLSVPADFEIPTCVKCGEESMVPEIAQKLDWILTSRIQPTQFQRGCVHDIDHVTMSKLPEGTKTATKNQWVLVCHFGPAWIWYNPTQSWTMLTGSVKWIDYELPFEVAHKLLHSIKSKRQIEEENKR